MRPKSSRFGLCLKRIPFVKGSRLDVENEESLSVSNKKGYMHASGHTQFPGHWYGPKRSVIRITAKLSYCGYSSIRRLI